jgi:hypothetical protein
MAAADRIDNVTYGREVQPRQNWNRHPPSSAGSPMELGNVNVRPFNGRTPRRSGNSRWTPSNSAKPAAGNYPRLTPEERQRLQEANACFYCREPGHQVQDCPQRGRRSGSRATPPNGRAAGRQ